MVKPKGVWLRPTELGEVAEATVVKDKSRQQALPPSISQGSAHSQRSVPRQHSAAPERRGAKPLLLVALGGCCCTLVALVSLHIFSAQALPLPSPRQSTGLSASLSQPVTAEAAERSYAVRVVADGREYLTNCRNQTVTEALHQVGVEISSLDEVSLPLDMVIETECIVAVSRIYSRTVTETEEIAPGRVRVEDVTLPSGASQVLSEGEPGLRENTISISYRDGEETGRVVVGSNVLKEPGLTTVAIGSGGLSSRSGDSSEIAEITVGGETYQYARKLSMESTAYTWTGNKTATGTWPAVGTIAVDPRVIPLGTRVYVEGYGFAVAEDTGGAIKGSIIDVYFNTNSECIKWGRKHGVAVYILE